MQGQLQLGVALPATALTLPVLPQDLPPWTVIGLYAGQVQSSRQVELMCAQAEGGLGYLLYDKGAPSRACHARIRQSRTLTQHHALRCFQLWWLAHHGPSSCRVLRCAALLHWRRVGCMPHGSGQRQPAHLASAGRLTAQPCVQCTTSPSQTGTSRVRPAACTRDAALHAALALRCLLLSQVSHTLSTGALASPAAAG